MKHCNLCWWQLLSQLLVLLSELKYFLCDPLCIQTVVKIIMFGYFLQSKWKNFQFKSLCLISKIFISLKFNYVFVQTFLFLPSIAIFRYSHRWKLFFFKLLIGQDGKVKVHRMPNQLLLLFLLDEIVFADQKWNLVVLVKTIGSRESCLIPGNCFAVFLAAVVFLSFSILFCGAHPSSLDGVGWGMSL